MAPRLPSRQDEGAAVVPGEAGEVPGVQGRQGQVAGDAACGGPRCR